MSKKNGIKRVPEGVAFADGASYASTSVKLCLYGLEEHPLCGKSPFPLDLIEFPEIRDMIEQRRVASYWFRRIDDDHVMIDGCLLCHLASGLTPEDYAEHERKASGFNRKQTQAWCKMVAPNYPFEWLE